MKERRYYVYIMASRSRRLYTGVTNSIFRRALEHKSGEIEGFTKRYKINRLVHYEEFKDVGNAIDREKQIEGWDRAKRVALIESQNPTWEDLAEDWGKRVPLQFDPRNREVFATVPPGPTPVAWQKKSRSLGRSGLVMAESKFLLKKNQVLRSGQ